MINRTTATIAAIAAAAFTLTACGSGDSEPTATVTETYSASVHDPPDFDEPVDDDTEANGMVSVDPEEEEETSTLSDDDNAAIGALSIELTWEEMAQTDKDNVCDGYVLMPEEIVDILHNGNEDYLTKADIRTFLDENC